MAQGSLKKPSAPKQSTSATNKSSGIIKKGSRTFKPKNTKLIKQAKMNKKFTAGLTAQTEKMLGERAGHLEMLGQGRKKGSGAPGAGAEKKGKGGSAGGAKGGKKG